ncbi:hypothetical protein BO99DRAFT_146394 [Aspergillus violaceofuscus CBS 115571]|uniref:Uncharacterized protein n=1 Tax=Aspergillus violaceofuscus (strain CBS 115571) TaxID=1450538 RepID=A0A2V5HS49_ASPV1|nr:hypothetical protein BO99DRAFT_146394 [Aspergillus violaceofuscus CBS 115571]
MNSHHVCLDYNIYYGSAGQLQKHVAQHHLRTLCNHYFGNENNLQMSHQARSMECYGCYQAFRLLSGMLIHLEAENCPSGTNEKRIECIDQGLFACLPAVDCCMYRPISCNRVCWYIMLKEGGYHTNQHHWSSGRIHRCHR